MIAGRVCSRRGSDRLAQLAAKFGPESSLRDPMDRFSYDCLWRTEVPSCDCVLQSGMIDGWPRIEPKGCPTSATCIRKPKARPPSAR